MKVGGVEYRTIWMDETFRIFMIEQNELPFRFRIFESDNYRTTCQAIKDMTVRGAGAIGVAAGFAMAQAFRENQLEKKDEQFLISAKNQICQTRPTARNLFYAVDKVFNRGIQSGTEAAYRQAQFLAEEDMQMSQAIGNYGNELISENAKILTHCNAGWLAFVDYGSALAPIYVAAKEQKNIFVFVDETRPRAQGARLTAWELSQAGIPFSVIPDNAAAYYMSQKEIDLVIVGADRIARNGDTANKIGTLEKAVCAKYFGIPFYIAAPTSTFDMQCKTGNDIPIEERSEDEVLFQTGMTKYGNLSTIRVVAPEANAKNPAFDVTPAELITGIITEYGVIRPVEENITKLLTK